MSGWRLSMVAVVGAAIGGMANVQAQTARVVLPDTPAGRQLAAWIEAFNSGDDARLAAYVSEEWPTFPSPSIIVESRRDSGGFTLLGIESATNTQVVSVVEERDWPGMPLRFTLNVEAEPPHRIRGAQLQPAPPGSGSPSVARLSEAELILLLRDRLEAASESGSFAGAVMLAKNGEPVFTYASGEADRENGVAITPQTKFRIGSMNKMFTAVAILQLVEQGRIELNAPIATYLTDYPNQDLASRVTVRHLLTHTGGTGDIFTAEYFAHRLEVREHADYIAMFGEREVAFTPGERYAYSNYGFVLLGSIIEAVTDGSYYDYVDAYVYARAEMPDSGSLPEAVDVPDRAVGYTRQPAPGAGLSQMSSEPRPNDETLPYRGTAAGGGYSSVGDLVRFAEALHTGVLVRPETLAMATSGQTQDGRYGFGFSIDEVNGSLSYGHSGGAPGMRAELRMFPQSGYALVYASNTDTSFGQRLISSIGARLPAE
jgi:D-alanyl-D-alanine carboxypeptidase